MLLELNEVNFGLVEKYVAAGGLPNFGRLFRENGFTETTSETEPEHLEPWIQWVTAHTGLRFAEHGVFRLGDIVGRAPVQIWERLEDLGYRVGAISPMNAELRMKAPAFFLPDPWTATAAAAPAADVQLHRAIVEAVNGNAEGRMGWQSALAIIRSSLNLLGPSNLSDFMATVFYSRSRRWYRALFLDLLLAELFCSRVKSTQVQFASLFLNGAAHLQHHYLFSSPQVDRKQSNPDWYLPRGEDPVGEVYSLYDRLLGRIRKRFPTYRIMVATGLTQDPYPEPIYYWRLRDHASFLADLGVPFASVEPRMSRDFLVCCSSAEQACLAEARLRAAMTTDGMPLFSVDNRGSSLFVELVYSQPIPKGLAVCAGNQRIPDLASCVAFVAIKNGGHNGTGFFADTGTRLSLNDRFPLTSLVDRILQAMSRLNLAPSATRELAA
ncbi:hypothetical protein [Thermaurantiacus sp.]